MKIPKGFGLQIEASSCCNQACNFCPHDKYRLKGRHLDNDRFYQIIDSIHDLKIPIRYITFSGMGEPLMDPSIWIKVAYAQKLCNPIEIYTNGKLLGGDNMPYAGKYLSRVYVSMHGNTPEEYENYSGNKFMTMRARFSIAQEVLGDRLCLLNYPKGKLAPLLDTRPTKLHGFHNWSGAVDSVGLAQGCQYCELGSYIMVNVDGTFGTCGNDWNAENRVLERHFPACEKCYSNVASLGDKLDYFIDMLEEVDGGV